MGERFHKVAIEKSGFGLKDMKKTVKQRGIVCGAKPLISALNRGRYHETKPQHKPSPFLVVVLSLFFLILAFAPYKTV